MIYFSFNFSHHGRYSSYHHLLDFVRPGDRKVDASLPSFCYSRWMNPRGIPIKKWRIMNEFRAWKLAERRGHEWVHYLYPEHTHFHGGQRKGKKHKMLFSCHLPPEVLNQHCYPSAPLAPFIRGLTEADGIILMSPDALEYYSKLAPQARITFIPHGIDIHHFSPSQATTVHQDGKLRVLTVGNMLRDFQRLAAVVRHVFEQKHGRVKFTVLASKANIENLRLLVGENAWKIVDGLWGIDDEALLKLYRESDLMFLPLLGATANNALLEAMATGLPMLVSDLPACRAYAGESALYFDATERAASLAERIHASTPGSNQLRELGISARGRAERNLSWESILAAHAKFVQAINTNQSWIYE